MAGRAVPIMPPPEVRRTLPPHIENHIVQWEREEAERARSSSAPSGASPPGMVASDGSTQPSSSSSPMLDFLKITRNKDGEKGKRRGPKPDSKPALTRKQELNRQAQRTHRERKEKYVRTLEEDVVRLREAFTLMTREKTEILQENRRLKALLESHGIIYDREDGGYGGRRPEPREELYLDGPNVMPTDQAGYDELGMDFVLTLERPCMEHMTPLTSNSANNPRADFHGHAMMLSCPPEGFSIRNPYTHWDMPKADLSILFHLSQRFQLDGEMTPIAVWATIIRHERFAELNLDDLEAVKQELLTKVKCYGFGAVIEQYEVNDALDRLFASKPSSAGYGFQY